MKTVALLFVIATASLLAVGCNKNTSTESQSTNEPWEQQPTAMNTNSPSAGENTNAAPSIGTGTNAVNGDK
jgi:ABC-type oligopeptide transport system substrate-binding subunit